MTHNDDADSTLAGASATPTRLLVGPLEVGLRFDQALAALSALSRRRARAVIGDGAVWRNGRPTRNQSRPVALGEVIDLLGEVRAELEVPPRPALPAVTIVHEDSALIAVDKPFGVLSQPAEIRQSGELAMDERVLLWLANREGRPPFLRLIHRLDRVTSGLLLFARHPRALAPLARAWRQGEVERRYLAVVEGVPHPPRQTIDEPIERDPRGGWRFAVGALGKPARSEVRLLRQSAATADSPTGSPSDSSALSMVDCRLLSGRTHQVRVHLAHIGHPVAGDRLYGAATNPAGRPLLHATHLKLPHPKEGRTLELHSEPPPEFDRSLDGSGS